VSAGEFFNLYGQISGVEGVEGVEGVVLACETGLVSPGHMPGPAE
jgi:hypothetical protein